MRPFLFLLMYGFAGGLSAQLPFQESFAAPTGSELPAGWSTADLSANAAPLLWERCTDLTACAPYTTAFTTETTFAAPSAADGYLTVNSDQHGNQPADFESVLSAPPIDCSAADTVFLSFYTFVATAVVPAAEGAVVEVRADGGPWTVFQPFCTLPYAAENLRSPNPQRVVLDLSSVAAQAAALEVRWRWSGEWEYSWSIDDVLVSATDPRNDDVIWGGASGEADFAGGLNGWTVNTLIAPNSDQGWQWVPDGYLGNAFFAADTRHLTSPSVCNGAVILNADFYSTGGDTPIDPPYPVYVSELVSPVIDLSAAAGRLTLEWYESLRLFEAAGGNAAPSQLSTSTDGGLTWSAPLDLHPELQQSEAYEGPAEFPLPAALSGAAQARFKFIFAAQFFWWGIDDVRIRLRPAHDLGLVAQFTALPPSAVIPASQVDSFYFLTDLRNNGSQPANGAELQVTVRDLPTATTIFADSLSIGTVPADTLLTDLFIEAAYTPPAQPGLYELRYAVSADSSDARPADNLVRRSFQISDSTFAKERGRTRAIAPSGTTLQYAYGNCFYLPRGQGWYGSSVTFGLANAGDIGGETLLINLLEWVGDLNGNGLADADTEYTVIGINAYTVIGGEALNLITVPLLAPDGTEVALRDDRYYLATVEYGGSVPCFFQASETYNYTATYVLSDSLGSPRYASVLKTDFSTNAYDLVGFGLDVVPVIRLNIRATPTAAAPPPAVPEWSVFPNPAARTLHWRADDHPAGNYRLRLLDAQGSTHLELADTDQGTIVLPRLADGMYFLEIQHRNGMQLRKKILIRQ